MSIYEINYVILCRIFYAYTTSNSAKTENNKNNKIE